MEQNVLTLSLRSYKKEIEALKGSLLGLNKDSEEYKKIANEIQQRQSKLNEVMAVGKNHTDAIDGSLQQMRKTLSEMKKDLAENYVVGSEAWKEQAKLVDELNSKVKKAEEEFGVFSRNVGNYSNSIVDAFGKMGVNLGGAEKAFQGLTNAQKGLNEVWNVMAKHPWIAAITIIIGVLMKLKDAISQNADNQKKWERAMSAFQPILNLFANALDKVVGVMVDVAEWTAKKIPTALTYLGKGIASAIKSVGWFVEAWLKFATFVPRKVLDAFNVILKGVSFVGDKIADFLDTIGLDKLAKGVKDAFNGASNIVDKFANGVEKTINNISGVFDGWSKSVTNAFNAVGKVQDEAYKRAQRQQKLNSDIAAQDKKNAESELKQAKLRDEIARASGERRIQLEKQLREEIARNYDENVKLARRQYEMAKEISDLTPDSKEEKARLRELENNVIRMGAAKENALASVDKKITKETEKAAKEQTKAEKDAYNQRLKEQAQFLKDKDTLIKQSQSNTKSQLEVLKADRDFEAQYQRLSLDDRIKYEDRKYEITKNGIDEEIRLQKEIVDSQLTNDNQKLAAQTKINALQFQLYVEDKNKYIAIQKEKADEAKYVMEQSQKTLQQDMQVGVMFDVNSFSTQLAELYKAFAEGNIKYEEYLQQKQDIENAYSDSSVEKTIQENYAKTDILKQYWESLLAIYGEDSQMVIDAHLAYEQAMTDATQQEAEKRAKIQEREFKKTQDINKKKLDTYMKFGKSLSGLMGVVNGIIEQSTQVSEDATEEERENAKKRFEVMKGVQIGIATMDMLVGAMGAYKNWKESPVGIAPWIADAMAIADYATTIAQGVLTISQIKSQQWNGGGSTSSVGASSSSMSMAAQTPLLNEELDGLSMQSINNEQNERQRDQRVIILESDLEMSRNRVEIRETNVTF